MKKTISFLLTFFLSLSFLVTAGTSVSANADLASVPSDAAASSAAAASSDGAGVAAAAEDNTVTLRVVHTNDLHGRYDGGEDSVGFAALQTIVNGDGRRADLVFDAGDAYHGLPFATVERGGAIAELFSAVGYTAMTPGNHDFNYGAAHLAELGTDSGVPILSCNILSEETGEPVFTPSVGLTVQGLRVGVIGVTSPDIYDDTAPANVEGLVFADPVEPVQDEIDRLHAEGCTLIFVLAHLGDSPVLEWTSERLVSGTTGIDVLIDGHTHDVENRLVDWKDGEGQALCVQTGAYFENVGVLTLTVDRETGRPVSLSTDCETLVSAADAAELTPDEAVEAQVEAIESRQSVILGNEIAVSPKAAPYSWEDVRCGQTAIGTLVADAYLAETGADVACENAGGIRGGIPKGSVTGGDVLAVAPFGNTVVTKEITGETLLSMLETSLSLGLRNQAAREAGDDAAWPEESGSFLQWSGLTVAWDPDAADGARVLSVKIGSRALDPDKTYILATNSFVAVSADYPALAASPEKNEYGACDELLRQYLSGAYEGVDWTDSLTRIVFRAEPSAVESLPEPPESKPAAPSEPEAVSSEPASASDNNPTGAIAVVAVLLILAAVSGAVLARRQRP